MMDPPPALDANTRAALQKLADIALPPEVSLLPATWGWAVLAGLAVMATIFLVSVLVRRRSADRYRREALAELASIEASLANEATRVEALRSIPRLLKQVALAAWPRADVASLSGSRWRRFLQRDNGAVPTTDDLGALLDGAEYRGDPWIRSIGGREAQAIVSAARSWIARHNGPA